MQDERPQAFTASHQLGNRLMNRLLLLSLLATAAAWLLIRDSTSTNRTIPAAKAAAKLQQAWADHHTTA
jgi:hypothetical protein